MNPFSSTVCLSLVHSLWQSALLLILYGCLNPMVKKTAPYFKKNLLFGLLCIQLITSVITFIFFYFNSSSLLPEINDTPAQSISLFHLSMSTLTLWLMRLYSLVLMLKITSLIYNWQKFKKTTSGNLTVPPEVLKTFALIKANEFGIKRKVTLWFSDKISTPLTFGFFKPVILIPVSLLNHISMQDAEALILHELTHIRDSDYLLNWLVLFADTIFFFNPFIKIIVAKIKLEREKNCDIEVLQSNYPSIRYAEILLRIARLRTTINIFPIAAAIKNRQLLQRVTYFTNPTHTLSAKRKFKPVCYGIIALTLLLNLFILSEVKPPSFDTININKIALAQPGRLVLWPADFTSAHALKNELNEQNIKKHANEQFAVKKLATEKHNFIEKVNKPLIRTEAEKNFAVQAANFQSTEKQVVVKEENSGTGEVITKVYQVRLKNGRWKKQLIYVIKEGHPVNDSSHDNLKGFVRIIPDMQ